MVYSITAFALCIGGFSPFLIVDISNHHSFPVLVNDSLFWMWCWCDLYIQQVFQQ